MKPTIALAAAASLILTGAAAPVAAKSPADKPAGHQQCFLTKNVENFAAPDDQTLNVRVNINDVYQFKMFGHCTDIDWANRIALVSRGSSWICDHMDAEVISPSAIGPQHCMVRDMRKLTPDEIKALPKHGRP